MVPAADTLNWTVVALFNANQYIVVSILVANLHRLVLSELYLGTVVLEIGIWMTSSGRTSCESRSGGRRAKEQPAFLVARVPICGAAHDPAWRAALAAAVSYDPKRVGIDANEPH